MGERYASQQQKKKTLIHMRFTFSRHLNNMQGIKSWLAPNFILTMEKDFRINYKDKFEKAWLISFARSTNKIQNKQTFLSESPSIYRKLVRSSK